jgi:hypothetical protein
MLEANHDGWHTNDDIQWRGYSGLSHEGSWSYMKIFETCVKSYKWIRRVSLHKASLMMCGTSEGIAKRQCKPLIIEDCLLSTPRDHSWWKARRPRYKLTSQDTFGADKIPLIYLWFISISEVDSIICLVFLIIMIGKNFLRVRGFVVLKICYMPNEPLPNERLVLSKKTYAIINHNFVINCGYRCVFFCNMICKSWTCFVLGQASDLKRANYGRNPKFH